MQLSQHAALHKIMQLPFTLPVYCVSLCKNNLTEGRGKCKKKIFFNWAKYQITCNYDSFVLLLESHVRRNFPSGCKFFLFAALLHLHPHPKKSSVRLNEKKIRFLPILPRSKKELKELLRDKQQNLDGKTFTSMVLVHF